MEKHRLTVYIEVLNEMANICIKRHLQKCENFFTIQGKEKGDEILNNTDSETTKERQKASLKNKKRPQLSEDVIEPQDLNDNKIDEKNDSFFDDSMSIITVDSTNSSIQRGPINKFAIRKPSKSQERKWWYVVLKATISNGWSFC
ncbi:13618_t:CDS:2 [Funneliformis mosseae]|uniref:13618_t:CDS:1 n=1 Tax=Funneliformis mosseae TaxID=27381 RepID=A0A9N9A5F9_FUNMO|nr:13618_t:CDS:2 [Funneliformis mosseae]